MELLPAGSFRRPPPLAAFSSASSSLLCLYILFRGKEEGKKRGRKRKREWQLPLSGTVQYIKRGCFYPVNCGAAFRAQLYTTTCSVAAFVAAEEEASFLKENRKNRKGIVYASLFMENFFYLGYS